MNGLPDRVLTFEHCFNFRDLGGYAGLDGRPVRWRRLFRSMTPQYMSEADAVAVAELKITLVIDFEGTSTAAQDRCRPPGARDWR